MNEILINEISPEIRMKSLLTQRFSNPVPVYLDADGNETTDISKAKLDVYGNVSFVRYSDKESIPHPCYSDSVPLSYNPNDSTACMRALQARENLNKYSPEVDILGMDKFEALQYAQNSVSALVAAVDSLPSSSVPPVESSK